MTRAFNWLPGERSGGGLQAFSIIAVAVLFGSFGSSAANAAKWFIFASCGDAGMERLYSYDFASVRKTTTGTAVQIQADYSRVPSSKAQRAKLVWVINCAGRSFEEKSRIEYGAGGGMLARYKSTKSMNIIPGSVAEKLAQKVCG